MYNRLLLHTFLVVLCHRKVIIGQFHGSYYPSAPRVAIGPYRPWEGRFPPPLPSVPHAIKGRLPANHPGYQTNIVIDQTGKSKSVVEITTEDLSTGLEVGKTEWSGPGTLTLSAIASFLENPRPRKRESPYVQPHQEYSHHQTTHHYPYPHGHPKNEFELIQVPAHHEPIQTPDKVLGKGCNSSRDCTKALNAVCSSSSRCQSGISCAPQTCQCPPYHHQHVNAPEDQYRRHYGYEFLKRSDVADERYVHLESDGGHKGPRRKRRSLKYYEECRHDPRYR